MQRGAADWEADIVSAGGCAARLQSAEQWDAHQQGRAVASEPLIIWGQGASARGAAWHSSPGRPLAGLKVLDLTRIIAGPVATRFLAGFGAEVLRIDPPDWGEEAVAPEVTLGKRCARLDLRTKDGLELFRQLLSRADILVHGYRKDALAGIGFDTAARQAIRPGLIDISLNAYPMQSEDHPRISDFVIAGTSSSVGSGSYIFWDAIVRPKRLIAEELIRLGPNSSVFESVAVHGTASVEGAVPI